MCRKVRCKYCQKWTWDGCGLHIKQIMKNINFYDKCRCFLYPPPLPAFQCRWGDDIIDDIFKVCQHTLRVKNDVRSKLAQAFHSNKISGFKYMTIYNFISKDLTFHQRRNFLTYYGWTLLNQIVRRDRRAEYREGVSRLNIKEHEEWVSQLERIVIYGIQSFDKYLDLLKIIGVHPETSFNLSFVKLRNIKLNKRFTNWFTPCQTFNNLVYSSLKTAETPEEIQTGKALLNQFIPIFYSYLGIKFDVRYSGNIILNNDNRDVVINKTIPLPKIPTKWKWNPEFIEKLYNHYQAAKCIYQIEWFFLSDTMLKHHDLLIYHLSCHLINIISKEQLVNLFKNPNENKFIKLLTDDIFFNLRGRCQNELIKHKYNWSPGEFCRYMDKNRFVMIDLIVRSIRHDGNIDMCYIISRFPK